MLRAARPMLIAARRPMNLRLMVPGAVGTLRFGTRSSPLLDKAGSGSGSGSSTSGSGSSAGTLKTDWEKQLAKKKLEARPEEVSVTSSRNTLFTPAEEREKADKSDGEVFGGVKQDLSVVKDTFALTTVPREPYVVGLAGTLPYFATSLSTLFLTWDLGQKWPLSNAFLNAIYIQHDNAQALLRILEPIQVGYGAVIISFLGAIHWGMEWSEPNSKSASAEKSRFRYAVGVAAPAVAWPTIMMPIEYALITQFAAFTGLYFVDAKAASRGWTPSWYGTYRFVLTFIVGTAIVISLVGRASLGEKDHELTKPAIRERLHPQLPGEDVDWGKLEAEEKKKRAEEQARKKKEEEEAKKKEKEKRGKKDGDEGKKGDDKKSSVKEKKDGGDDNAEDGGNDGDSKDKDEAKDDDRSDKGKDEQKSDEGGKGESKQPKK